MTTTATRPATKAGPPPRRPAGSVARIVRPLRMGWRRLISMRTALVLLFLLALASVPGSLLPQRTLNPTNVEQYLATHGWWGRLLDRLGFFDVFGSVWFSAIYLLLAISLIGCLVPRIRVYARALRTKPLPAPRHLGRLPESATFTIDSDVETARTQLTRRLGRRWRTKTREDERGTTISAEKGYSREAGNLVFHVALLGALVTIAVGRLFGYEGNVVTQEGGAFCNTRLVYDSFRSGRLVGDGSLAPFCVNDLRKFTATYLDTGEPDQFRADITYSRGVDGAPRPHVITVNHPLRIEGARVYLISHGFAPTVTVRYPDGRSLTTSASFIPQDPTTYFSEGAFEFPAKENAQGKHTDDLGIAGFFAPTPVPSADGTITSASPQARNPVLGLRVYQGDVGNTGVPRSVYSLDQTQITTGALKPVAMKDLREGQSLKLADGTTITYNGYKQWASFQVSHDPAQRYLLVFAVLMVAGLITSLGIRRRRLWMRLRPGSDPEDAAGGTSRTVIEVGGLARSDSGNFGEEFRAVVARLQGRDDDMVDDTVPPVAGPGTASGRKD